MEVPLKSCEVIPDEFSLGKTVLMLSSNHQSKSIMGYQYKVKRMNEFLVPFF